LKALITVVNRGEAEKVIKAGCDILDIKDPSEGSLGASCPWVIKDIVAIVPKKIELSIAVGDVPNLPGTVSMAVFGALQFNPNYIKVGLKGPSTKSEAVNLMKKVVRTAETAKSDTSIVATCYADYMAVGSVSPFYLPDIVLESGAKIAMIDTIIKDGKNLLNLMSKDELQKIVRECHKRGIKFALAGSLSQKDIKVIVDIGVDIVGIRGAVCYQRQRASEIDIKLVNNFYNELNRLS
jgi:(5-formylfuran-3-yl)methyl phosphate synthase